MNREIRRKDRAVSEYSQIEEIIKSAKYLHLGLIDDGFPYIVPLHYGYEYDKEKDCFIFYMHSAKEGHKLNLIRADSSVCIELETNVALVSGENVPCTYGAAYSSVIGTGTASIVTDMEEKRHGLTLLMENQTGEIFEFTEPMLSSVAVIKVEVESYSAKEKRN